MCKGAVTKDDMDHYAAITYHIAIAVLWREREKKKIRTAKSILLHLFLKVLSMILINKKDKKITYFTSTFNHLSNAR